MDRACLCRRVAHPVEPEDAACDIPVDTCASSMTAPAAAGRSRTTSSTTWIIESPVISRRKRCVRSVPRSAAAPACALQCVARAERHPQLRRARTDHDVVAVAAHARAADDRPGAVTPLRDPARPRRGGTSRPARKVTHTAGPAARRAERQPRDDVLAHLANDRRGKRGRRRGWAAAAITRAAPPPRPPARAGRRGGRGESRRRRCS